MFESYHVDANDGCGAIECSLRVADDASRWTRQNGTESIEHIDWAKSSIAHHKANIDIHKAIMN
jgi:hypothetical protein